jgi:hypothetical protein
MQSKLELLERCVGFMRQIEGSPTPRQLHALLIAVYADGVRDTKAEIAKLSTKMQMKAANGREATESGLFVQQGRRLAAEELLNQINSLPAIGDDLEEWVTPDKWPDIPAPTIADIIASLEKIGPTNGRIP